MRTAFINEQNKVTAIKRGDWTASRTKTTLVADGEVCHEGMLFDASGTPRFVVVPIQIPPAVAPKWTAFQFLLRFTEAERAAFRDEAATDPKVADFMLLCGAASEIESTHPMTVAGMDYLVSAGLLTQARADEVLGK